MKKQIVNALTMFIFVVAFILVTTVASASAQSLTHNMRVTVPFDFIVGAKTLPAGEYSVGRAAADSDIVLLIIGLDNHENVNRITIPVQTNSPGYEGKLVFNHYGDQYFLFQVWTPGESAGRELPKSHSERALERRLAAHAAMEQTTKAAEPERVTIIASLR